MVLVVIFGAGGVNFGDKRLGRINIFTGRRADDCAVVVLGDDFGAGENVDRGRCRARAIRQAFLNAEAVAIVNVGGVGAHVVD
jgi:hypothetical protein